MPCEISHRISVQTSIGCLTVTEENGFITRIALPGEIPPMQDTAPTPVLLECARQITEYFNGQRMIFQLPLSPKGTDFQKKVWEQLLQIPYGETRTYGELAAMAGSPKGARAAGIACHNNPIAVVIPCHRVIGKNGDLTGYAGGLSIKQALLKLENTANG